MSMVGIQLLLYTVGVGFGIAYSVTKGNARAQTRGISKKFDPALFYCPFEPRENNQNNNCYEEETTISFKNIYIKSVLNVKMPNIP